MFFAISLLYCSFAVYIKQQCPPKRASFLRFLAESNCCKRFCRPVPNHSAKEPCCGFASANLGIIFGICKFFLIYFSDITYFLHFKSLFRTKQALRALSLNMPNHGKYHQDYSQLLLLWHKHRYRKSFLE